MGKETKNLVLEVSSGIVIFTVAAMLVALIVYPKPSVFAGLLLGMVLALAMFFSMAEVLDRSMKTEDAKTVQKKDGEQFGHPLCRAFCCSGYRRGLVSGSGQCGCPSNRSPRTQGWCISAAGYTQDRVTWEKRGVIFVYRSRCDQVRKEA